MNELDLYTLDQKSWSFKNIIGQSSPSPDDSSLIGFLQSGTGAVARSVQSKLREIITSPDYASWPIGVTGVGVGVFTATVTGAGNTAFGASALAVNTSGYANTAVGYQAMLANTTGGSSTNGGNTAIGAAAMISNTSGDNNTALGLDALYTNQIGYSNTAIGSNALGFGQDGHENVAVGWRSLFNGGANVGSTAVGVKSLNANLTGTGNIAVGYFAGAYELGSNAFYVDNQDRTNTAGDKFGALLYGTFNATPANQTLRVNGSFTSAYGVKAASNDIAVFSTTDGSLATAMQLIVTNITTAAIRLQAVQQGTGFSRLDLNTQGGIVQIASAGVATNVLGTFGCNGATAQASSTGYGTPTNGAKQASFDATAITLVNLAKATAQLIIDLKAFGFLAA